MEEKTRKLVKRVLAFLIGSGLLATIVGFGPDIIKWLTNEAPVVEWTVSPTQGDAPLVVVADANVNDPDDDALTLAWYVDEEPQTEGHNTSHEFRLDEPGQYRLRVIVSDGGADPVERVQLVTVSRPILRLQSMTLDRAFAIEEPDKEIELPAQIITNGHSLSIVGHSVRGTGSAIRAFLDTGAPDGRNGANGRNGGAGQDGTGGNGGAGTSGGDGSDGGNGHSAGTIYLKAEVIETTLTIVNNGQAGGNGGNGGNAGDGGRGGQGRSARDGIGAFGVGNCESGPGHGGTGGAGGNGGRGGNAGVGGDGGVVTIEAIVASRLSIEARGGSAGMPGTGGAMGNAGAGGAEGSSTRYCSSANRFGSRGADGTNGSNGSPARNGSFAAVIVRLGNRELNGENGQLSYP